MQLKRKKILKKRNQKIAKPKYLSVNRYALKYFGFAIKEKKYYFYL